MKYNEMTLPEVTRLDGVKDLEPALCRGRFAQALRAEARGEPVEAERLLAEAIAKAA